MEDKAKTVLIVGEEEVVLDRLFGEELIVSLEDKTSVCLLVLVEQGVGEMERMEGTLLLDL